MCVHPFCQPLKKNQARYRGDDYTWSWLALSCSIPVSCSMFARFCRISAKLETMAVKLSTAMARDTCFSSLVTSLPLSVYRRTQINISIYIYIQYKRKNRAGDIHVYVHLLWFMRSSKPIDQAKRKINLTWRSIKHTHKFLPIKTARKPDVYTQHNDNTGINQCHKSAWNDLLCRGRGLYFIRDLSFNFYFCILPSSALAMAASNSR